MKIRKLFKICYILFCEIIMSIPSLGMLIAPTISTTENKTMMVLPELISYEGGWNIAYLSELGDYFQEHFALRQEMITINAGLYGNVFHTSVTGEVLLGTDGWMYYSGDLPDFQCRDMLSDRGIFNAVHNLKLIQRYVESQGTEFLVTIAPNKSSLYDKNMPYYYKKAEEENNLSRMTAAMKKAGINYVDLYAMFSGIDEVLYFERDSHWHNKGAALAACALMDEAKKDHPDYINMLYKIRKDHLGDLTDLLYPLNSELENNIYYQREWQYHCKDGITDYMTDWIETYSDSDGADGVILMYRDSFGESMLPFLAEAYTKGYFSRLVPYDLSSIGIYHPDTVIIERVERRISAFANDPPIMCAPEVEDEMSESVQRNEKINRSALTAVDDDIFILFEGSIDQDLMETDTEIIIKITNEEGKTKYYAPFYVTKENEDNYFSMRIDKDVMTEGNYTAQILVLKDGLTINAGVFQF